MFVKICGITNEDDALFAVAMGADAVGFIFAPSPRQVAAQQVYDITRRLPPEILTVGVFRDEAPARVIDTVHRAGLKAAQLHGHETPDMVAEVSQQIRWVIKAVTAGSPDARRADQFGTDMVLVDSPGGGSGKVFDWSLLDEVAEGPRIILAGGHSATVGCRRGVGRGALTRPQGRVEGEGVHRTGPCRCSGTASRARHDALRLGRRRGMTPHSMTKEKQSNVADG
jgi:phosphoribosylanthranilate isomerase